MNSGKLNFYIARDFSVGLTIYSYALNGVCFELRFFCLGVRFWSKSKGFISFNNYWKGNTTK